MRSYQALELLRGGARPTPAEDIPVIINSYNRVTYLKQQLEWLEAMGFRRITILDNASTYPPLLEFYRRTSHEVVPLGSNLGPHALWKHPIFRRFEGDYYIYTDPDVVGTDECPPSFLQFFFDTLERNPWCEKVGLGLKVDDLPAHRRDQILDWEGQFWKKPYGQHTYDAPLDTTLALYRPYAAGGSWCQALRTAGPYQARHLPWYEDSAAVAAETRYYRARLARGSSHWMSRPGQYMR